MSDYTEILGASQPASWLNEIFTPKFLVTNLAGGVISGIASKLIGKLLDQVWDQDLSPAEQKMFDEIMGEFKKVNEKLDDLNEGINKLSKQLGRVKEEIEEIIREVDLPISKIKFGYEKMNNYLKKKGSRGMILTIKSTMRRLFGREGNEPPPDDADQFADEVLQKMTGFEYFIFEMQDALTKTPFLGKFGEETLGGEFISGLIDLWAHRCYLYLTKEKILQLNGKALARAYGFLEGNFVEALTYIFQAVAVLKFAYSKKKQTDKFDDYFERFITDTLKVLIRSFKEATDKLVISYLAGPFACTPFQSGVTAGNDGDFCNKCTTECTHGKFELNDYWSIWEYIQFIFKRVALVSYSLEALVKPEMKLPEYLLHFSVMGDKNFLNGVLKSFEEKTASMGSLQSERFTYNTPVVVFKIEPGSKVPVLQGRDSSKIGILRLWLESSQGSRDEVFDLMDSVKSAFGSFKSYKIVLENDSKEISKYFLDILKDLGGGSFRDGQALGEVSFRDGFVFSLPTWLNKLPHWPEDPKDPNIVYAVTNVYVTNRDKKLPGGAKVTGLSPNVITGPYIPGVVGTCISASDICHYIGGDTVYIYFEYSKVERDSDTLVVTDISARHWGNWVVSCDEGWYPVGMLTPRTKGSCWRIGLCARKQPINQANEILTYAQIVWTPSAQPILPDYGDQFPTFVLDKQDIHAGCRDTNYVYLATAKSSKIFGRGPVRYSPTIQHVLPDGAISGTFWDQPGGAGFHHSHQMNAYPIPGKGDWERGDVMGSQTGALFKLEEKADSPGNLSVEVVATVDCDISGWDFDYLCQVDIVLDGAGGEQQVLKCWLKHWPQEGASRSIITARYQVYGKAEFEVSPGQTVKIRKQQHLWRPETHYHIDPALRDPALIFKMAVRIDDVHVSWKEAPDLY